MVNSGSFDATGSEGESVKAEFTQLEDDAAEANFTAVVPETAQLDTNHDKPTRTSLQCSVPLDKVKNVLELCNNKSKLNNIFILENYLQKKSEVASEHTEPSKPAVKRLMCLFCDRTFTSNNLKQKHVDRCHSSGQTRRSSSRTSSQNQSTTACCFCSKLNHTDHTLKQLLEHLINEHSNRYFACLTCQERFSSVQSLRDHNRSVHGLQDSVEPKTSSPSPVTTSESSSPTSTGLSASEVIRPELKRTCSNDSNSKSEHVLPTTPKENSSPSNSSATKLKRNSSLKNISIPETNVEENTEKSTGFKEDFEDAILANIISPEEAKKFKTPEVIEDLTVIRKAKNGAVNSKAKESKKNLVNKKISVKSTKNGLRSNLRTTRASVKQINNNFNKPRKNKVVKNKSEPNKEIVTKKHESNPASVFSLVNAYTYKYEKIYDHASDSIKDANSVQFNAVFDREFYSRTVCNIRENLLNHLDGKLNRNIESETRISNFEHNANVSETETKPANDAVDNFGCDLSLNAVTPVATLLCSSQYGEDFDAQIEYGAKASQKKAKKVAVVKYKFPNKKYNSLFREKDSQNDLTCLDMWTQLSVKKRQHKLHGDVYYSEGLLNYQCMTNETKLQVEELNRILDTRGHFEDLRLEANAAQFLELRKKSAKDGDNISEEASKDVYFVIEDLLNRVMCKISEKITEPDIEEIKENEETKIDTKMDMSLPGYLQLQKKPTNYNEYKIDQTDKIAIICSSQDEEEMKENKRLELSGEWARPRIYICATCGLKLPNLKSLEDHKNTNHSNIWCSHYEFVGNQSQIYRHLSIPGLGKVGVVELLPVNRQWQRSNARVCSKCSKHCHNLGELHKHILECGGDWTWMLARKKCKYRPYGARTRRRRQRGYKRSCNPEVNRAREHKPKIKQTFIGPRPKPTKPSDAETIERMLANLPAKRNRKMISMRDGIQRPRKPYKQKLNNQNSQSNSSSKSSNKKVHFKNNSSQITKQTLRNALKRKISANNLRKQNKNYSESDNSDTPLTLRSRVRKNNDDTNNIKTVNESDITQQLIGKRSNIRNKRMISRILGSKIFDTNSALVTRRKIVKAIAQNNLIRRTRLRCKMNAQQPLQTQKDNNASIDETGEKLSTKNKVSVSAEEKKTKANTKNQNNSDENNSNKLIKTVDSISKSSESNPKIPKKSKTKRILSVLTKSNKKTKAPTKIITTSTDKDKPDTISAIINAVIKASTLELHEEKLESEEKTDDKKIRRTRSSSSLLKVDPNESKNNSVEENAENKSDNSEDKLSSNKSDVKNKKVLAKKTNKLVQNVKSLKKSFRKPTKNKTEEKGEGITSKIMRTLSIRGSKKKKTESKKEIKAQTITASSETIDQEIDLKKTTTDVSNQSKEPEIQNKTSETVVEQCDTKDSDSKANSDSDIMPTLEKIELLPSNVSSNTSANSIPVLSAVNMNPSCETNIVPSVEIPKETISDSDVSSEVNVNKTIPTSCDSNVNNCNNALNKFKSKIKRSGRGLNDCIAMLKCKLEQKYPNTEPSLVDKSNLFILNSSQVNKHSQPIVQEKDEITASIFVESTKVNQDILTSNVPAEEAINVNLKNSVENKISEEVNEVVNEPKIPEIKSVSVLEIPSVKIHSKNEASTSEMSTVETQTQTVDEDIVPNAAIDYIHTDLQTNFQLSYVLNATLQNCLMECVKNKCETFKIENQNYPVNKKPNQNKSGTKIGSVRKRKPKAKVIDREKHIPNIPVLLNTAFTEKIIPKKVNKKQNTNNKDSIKAASDTSDDDIPLSKFVSNASSCTKLKIKLPVAKKKRSLKKHIAFTPLILNNQDSCIPQISLQERIEQRISLDSSMNNKTEATQNEMSATKVIDTTVVLNTNTEIINENNSTASNIEHKTTKNNITELSNEKINNDELRDKELSDSIQKNIVDHENIPVDLSTKHDFPETDVPNETVQTLPKNNDEPVENLNNDSSSELNIEEQSAKLDDTSSKLDDSNKELLQQNFENISKPEEINDISKETVTTKDVVEFPHPLSQQIMTTEDEPCDNFLMSKTLTEANIKPSTTTKNVLQTNSSSENIEFINKINHFDSGKENTECQDIKKQKKVIKKQKKKRGRSKIVDPQAEINESVTDITVNTDLDQSIEKNEPDINISIENTPIILNEEIVTNNIEVHPKLEIEIEPKKPKIKRKRGRSRTTNLQSKPTAGSDITISTEIGQSEKSESNVCNMHTEDAPKKQIDDNILATIETQLEPELENEIKPIPVKPKGKRGRRKTVNLPVKSKEPTVDDSITALEEPISIIPTEGSSEKGEEILTNNTETQQSLPVENEIKPVEVKPKGKRGRRKTINVQMDVSEPIANIYLVSNVNLDGTLIKDALLSTDESVIEQPSAETKTESNEEKPKKRRGRRKAIKTQEDITESIIDTSITDLKEILNSTETPTDVTITETFKSQLQSTLEIEPESTVMESKTIQDKPKICIKIKPIINPAVEKPATLSDSEDEVPLAVLIKTKPQNESSILVENTELPLEAMDSSKEVISELYELNEVTSNAVNDTYNMKESVINIENTSYTIDDASNKNSDVESEVQNEEISELDNMLCENTENNKELSVTNDDNLEISESNSEINSEAVCIDNENKEEISQNIAETSTESDKYLETHFNEENYSETINSENTPENISCENTNDDVKETSTPKTTETDQFDFLKTPTNKQASDNESSFITTPDLTDKSLVIKIKTNLKIKIKKPKRTRRRVIPKSLSKCNIRKRDEEDTNVAFLCEICNKTFKRKENLASHKKTLTHIAKLSEIEARESMSKRMEETDNENSTIKEPGTEMALENEEDNLLREITTNNEETLIETIQNDINPMRRELDIEKISNMEDIETNNIVDISNMADTETDNIDETISSSASSVDKNVEIEIKNVESELINLENILENNKESDIIEVDNQENTLNEIEDDLLPNIGDKSPINIPTEDKEIIEIHDESSADSQTVIISETENLINISEIVKPAEKILDIEPSKQNTNLLPGFMVNSSNTNLKLVDIISEVLDKPVNNLNIGHTDYLPQNITRSANCDSNDKYSEPKRYKSLGERKSFDSDNFKSNDEITKENYNASMGSVNNGLLSKQLSLLENIIEETNPNLNYIDDSMSLSSNQFDEPVQNIATKDLFKPVYAKLNHPPQIKFSHNTDVLSSFIKPNNHFNNFENISQTFAKPVEQTEANIEPTSEERKKSKDNSKRKILNRDEELFLECCSLLKSGPEISSVSKKSTKNIPLNSFSRSNDASWTIQKQPNSDQFIQRDSYSWLAQSSRVDTPIGEPFVNNDWSNSNSAVSSEWLAQKAPSPDRPTENNTLLKKSNNNSGETKYSDIQFEDISIDSSLETSKTLMAIDNSNTENIPLDFHHVDFSSKNLIEVQPEDSEEYSKGSKNLEVNPIIELNENSENTTKQDFQEEQKDEDEPQLRIDEDVPNKDEFDADLKKKVVSAFGGLMAKALSNRLHAVVRRSKKAKGKRDFASALQASITDYAVPVKKNKLNPTDSDSSDCPKKLMTKGAMKVFEGLKVSIPTQDLNLKEVLNCTNKPKNGETVNAEIEPIRNGDIKKDIIFEKSTEKVIEENNKNGKIKNLFGRFGNKLGLRETKKKTNKHRSKSKNNGNNKKTHDIYEFEESVDSNFMFKSGKFSLFRNKEQNSEKSEKSKTTKEINKEKIDDTKLNHESGISSLKWNGNESDSDTDRYYDSMSFEEMSLSSESTHGSDLNLNKTKQVPKKNSEKSKDNQKKCMIMGRIFKNASKPKLEDKIPEIRDISSEENSKLVEIVDNTENTNHELLTVPNNVTVVNNSANKMSKIEMDLLFDKLLEEEKKHTENTVSPVLSSEIEKSKEVVDLPPPIPVDQNHIEKKKAKESKTKAPGKTKKRQRHNSGDSSSAEEFTLAGRHSKSSKKHHKIPRKSTKTKKDTGINLEQEMKECIGVAGRKSQRKCTSGKQNVLVEYWSSDESSFEEVIKMLGKENEPIAPIEEEKKTEEFKEPAPIEPQEPLINNHSNSQEIPVAKIVENIPKHTVDIYDFDSDVEPKQDSLKIKIKLNEPLLKPEHEFIATSKIKIPKKTKRFGKSRKHMKSHGEESETEFEIERNRKREHKRKKSMENGETQDSESNPDCLAVSRKKRNAGDQLYYWSSSSEDEFQDLIEVKPIREDTDDDRPMQHGWIVGDSPKKLVTMLAQAKGKKVEGESVKEQGKKNRVTL